MKFVIVCFTLLVGALAYNWDAHELECAKELGTDKTIVEGFGDPLEKATPIDNKAYNDFTECSWKKQGLLKNDGNVNWEAIDDVILQAVKEAGDKSDKSKSNSGEQFATLMAGGLLSNLIEKCHNVHGDTQGQTLVKIQNCIGIQLRTLDSSEENKS